MTMRALKSVAARSSAFSTPCFTTPKQRCPPATLSMRESVHGCITSAPASFARANSTESRRSRPRRAPNHPVRVAARACPRPGWSLQHISLRAGFPDRPAPIETPPRPVHAIAASLSRKQTLHTPCAAGMPSSPRSPPSIRPAPTGLRRSRRPGHRRQQAHRSGLVVVLIVADHRAPCLIARPCASPKSSG